MYPTKLQLNKANSFDTEATFLDLDMSKTKDIVSSKVYDKRDDIDFEIIFPIFWWNMFLKGYPLEAKTALKN